MKGLTEKVGSLYENTYPELEAQHKLITKRLQSDPASYCHICDISYGWWKYKMMKLGSMFFKNCDWVALNKVIFG
jgi:hypothetical protein